MAGDWVSSGRGTDAAEMEYSTINRILIFLRASSILISLRSTFQISRKLDLMLLTLYTQIEGFIALRVIMVMKEIPTARVPS